MDEQTKLILALHQVDGITGLTKNNPYKQFIYQHLSSIKYELERQLGLLTNPPQLSKISTDQTKE